MIHRAAFSRQPAIGEVEHGDIVVVVRCIPLLCEGRLDGLVLVVSLAAEGVCDPNAVRYLNRLSDFLFVAARFVNVALEHHDEILYKRPSVDSKQRVAAARGSNNGAGAPHQSN